MTKVIQGTSDEEIIEAIKNGEKLKKNGLSSFSSALVP